MIFRWNKSHLHLLCRFNFPRIYYFKPYQSRMTNGSCADMNLKRLCFTLHWDLEELEKNEKISSGGCSLAVSLDFIRRSLRRFIGLSREVCCGRKVPKTQFSGVFYDAEGLEIETNAVAGENPRIFSYSELYIGSNGFSEKEILGSGGFGRVYRAVLPSDGTVVAVKCLTERGESFEKTFLSELAAVAHLRHRNLVRLRGWCIHDGELLLVYDYMPKGSLDKILFKRTDNLDPASLTWDTRSKIVCGLASALHYLHENLETQIIHRDVKASNVMLDSHFNARLGDFGLARWLEHDLHYEPFSLKNREFRLAETTRIGGTIGYLAPESFQKWNNVTAKSDVFSFGIVALEVISGRRAVDLSFPDNQIVLLDWIRRLADKGRLARAVDARLRQDESLKLPEMERLIRVGLMCTLHDPQTRPSMKWVMEVLSSKVHCTLPDLPAFQAFPAYISLSSPTGTSTSNTVATKSSTTTSISTNGETIYFSAQSHTSSVIREKVLLLPMVETPRVISYEEIVAATSNFSDSQRVAEVDFGTAYHGVLGGRRVYVKRLGMKTCPALRMRFANEFRNMERLRHRNLLQLRGWCTEYGEMLVVYDHSASLLLSHILFHQEHKVLNWHQRYKIVKALASAICYLHEEWDEQVIHRNITSSAIYLDQEMNPRLGSFALSEFLTRNEQGNHHVVVDKRRSVCGIFGYISPDYNDSGEATTMTDVYSYGVVVLEVVTGQKAVDFRRRDVLLVERVHELGAQKKDYKEMADRRLNGDYNERELERLMKLGVACTRSDPDLRPSMRQIMSILDGHEQWFLEQKANREKRKEWKQRNASSLSLVRRTQALGLL